MAWHETAVEPPVALVLVAAFSGFAFAVHNYRAVASLRDGKLSSGRRKKDEDAAASDGEEHKEDRPLVGGSGALVDAAVARKIDDITSAISEGANAFLFAEYKYVLVFMLVFGTVVGVLLGTRHNWADAATAVISFFFGALTSLLAGFTGMRVAVMCNRETAIQASVGLEHAFRTSFRGGAVMGFNLVASGLVVLTALIFSLRHFQYPLAYSDPLSALRLFESVAGFGLGASSVALFGRVGGGIFTKAADVGADLSGKIEASIPEDDARNPAVIADNVGDNVGDIAGMGADLFGSLAESTCAALVLTSQSDDLFGDPAAMMLPLAVTAAGLIVSLATAVLATHVVVVRRLDEIEQALKQQLLVSTVLMTPVFFVVTGWLLPAQFQVSGVSATPAGVAGCLTLGLWTGLLVGYSTDYFTSNAHAPVREMAQSCRMGPAPNLILGLAVGYHSAVVPALAMAAAIYGSHSLAGSYGVAMAALGILSTMAVSLSIDAYGPICDNAGGIAEMSGLGPDVRAITDGLDSAGNTTAAIGKGFAIGSAAFVALALFGAFVKTENMAAVDVVGNARVLAGLLVGAMLPLWFSALTVRSVGVAAYAMVEEVRRQFRDGRILAGTERPDYSRCVQISTEASLGMMVAPGLLVVVTPIVVGFLGGVECLAGVLAGSLVSGVQMAVSASNTGGAWDNAKKFIERDGLCLKGSHDPADAMRMALGGAEVQPQPPPAERRPDETPEQFYQRLDRNEQVNQAAFDSAKRAAVVGDTVGDPLKDTSGPSLNILIKLMAIISLVLASSFPKSGTGGILG